MLEAGKTYQYFYEATEEGNPVYIEQIVDGVAHATSGTVGDMGPFAMRFDAETGCGLGDYTGTYLVIE